MEVKGSYVMPLRIRGSGDYLKLWIRALKEGFPALKFGIVIAMGKKR